jgi:hypothetical protein
VLVAPIGPGVYELRRGDQLVLVGISSRCVHRMCSLLPPPWGSGTRNNAGKRKYVWRHLAEIEYRTFACATREEAARVEREMLRGTRRYLFAT